MPNKTNRGGLREPAGGRPTNESKGLPKREKHSPTLAPGIKELAQRIAKKQGWPGWGYAVDAGIEMLAKKLGVIWLVESGPERDQKND